MIIPKHDHYVGIDVGHKGAIAMMSADGIALSVWPMPNLTDDASDLDCERLQRIFETLSFYNGRGSRAIIGLEWSQAWPGSFGGVLRDAENFGRQKGVLESFAYCYGMPLCRIPPATWMGKLGLDSKARVGATAANAAFFDASYPQHTHLIRGPRGGILDGPLDALLITHYMRLVSGSLAQSTVRGSMEHLAAVLSMGKGKRKRARMPRKDEV